MLGCILWVFVMLSLGLKRRSTQSGAENVRVSVRGGEGMSDTHAVRCSCQETECGGPLSDQVKELFASRSTPCVYLVALYLSTAVQLMTRADAIQRLSLHTRL